MKYICANCNEPFTRKANGNYTLNFCCKECYNEYRKQEYTEKFKNRFGTEFELISFEDNKVLIKCKMCDETFKRNTKLVWQNGITCNTCKKRQTIEKQREVQHLLDEIRRQRAVLRKLTTRLENANKKCIERANKTITKECACCGKEFETTKNTQVYCCKQCANKAQNKAHELKRERHIKNNGLIDKDITLVRLYERDKGICYLCGCECDYSDFEMVNDVFKVGKTYPSIEHIIPISKGGTHSWDNIKLAHISCNSKKKDK